MLTRCVPGDVLGIAWSRTFYSLLTVNSSALVVPAANSCTARRMELVRHPILHWPLALQLSLPDRRRQVLLPLAMLGRVVLFIWPIGLPFSPMTLRSDENNTDLTKVTHVVDVHLPPASPKSLKGLTKRHRGSAESLDFVQPKQSQVSTDAHNRESFKDRSARVAPVVSVQPPVTPSVSDWASCDEDYLSMETSDDIFTTIPRGPTVSKIAVQPDPSPPMTGRSDDGSHHSTVGRKAAVQRPGTSQLPVSSRRLIISSQVSHKQPLQKVRPSTAPK
ncbi:hypothetical protein E2C01_068689 [Portunus trituberculatus]|uniref:Uncharacterized protein n=1 Tax=Portunus trituberculatus TaxID=210409 RepID=A0A5B7HSN4_PORTR|nr:hypothetical protein [Portunus trituberculatus]